MREKWRGLLREDAGGAGGGGSDPPRTFIRVDLSGERGVTRLAMRPEYRTKVAPDAMGKAPPIRAKPVGRDGKNGAPTLVESASASPTGSSWSHRLSPCATRRPRRMRERRGLYGEG